MKNLVYNAIIQYALILSETLRLYDMRDDFVFHIVNFLYLSSNILESPAYGVFVSQSMRIMIVLLPNMKIFCSKDLFRF